jgi:TonB-dependent receptor
MAQDLGGIIMLHSNGLELRETDQKRARFALRCGASAIALCMVATATAASAQVAADAADPDVIVVTGIKGSLDSSRAVKKNSDTIVDSVTAEDIGALPDRSVTETLQRIPGVSVTRFAALVDPDHFSVEGSGVTIRGLPFTRSEINGRDAFTANNGRGLGFADVPAELLSGVDVYKSPSSDRIEGGTSGLVNLRTRLPFDSKGMVLAGTVSNTYSDFAKKSSPEVSVLGSARWDTGIGEIGVLGSFVYSQLLSRSDGIQLSAFRQRKLYPSGGFAPGAGETNATPGRIVGAAAGAAIRSQDTDRERYGFSGALQWRSNDGKWDATFQFLRSDARSAWTERAVEVTTDNVESQGGSRPAPGTTFNYDSTGLFDRGTITGTTGWRSDQFSPDVRVPINGLQSNNIRRDKKVKNVTNDFAGNLKWRASDRLSFNLDVQHVNSKVDDLDVTIWASTYQNAFLDLNGRGLPTVQFTNPEVCSGPLQNATCAGAPNTQNSPTYLGAGHTSFTDPYNSFYRASMDHIEKSEGKSDAVRFDVDYNFDDNNWVKSIRAGVRHAERNQTARFSQYNWGVLSEQWGNNGPVWLDEPVNGDPATAGGAPLPITEPYFFDNFLGGAVPNPLNGQGRQFINFNLADDYARYVAVGRQINAEWQGATGGGWVPLASRNGVIAGTPFTPGEINTQKERNNAAYLQVNYAHDFSSAVRLTGNIGVRYAETTRISTGVQQFNAPSSGFESDATCATRQAAIDLSNADPANPRQYAFGFCALTVAERTSARAFANGAVTTTVVNLKYHNFLPSFNAKLEVGGGLQFRAAFSKSLTPAEFGLTRNYFNLGVGAVQNADANGNLIPGSFRLQAGGNAGNPRLLPIEGDNYDLTAEWYFGQGGQITLAGFYKTLKNQQTNGLARVPFTNNGQTISGVVTSAANSTKKGKVYGFEVAYRQNYDFLPGFLSGLGLDANYTYAKSNGLIQSTLSATDPDVAAGRNASFDIDQLQFAGLSKHTVNITPYYQRGAFEMRASYSWRSEYTLTIRDVITPFQPIVSEATGQLDGSIFLAVTPQLKLGLQGVNLLNEISKTKAVYTADGSGQTAPRSFFKNDRRVSFLARFNF